MKKMTEDNSYCRIGYTKSQAWILKVLQDLHFSNHAHNVSMLFKPYKTERKKHIGKYSNVTHFW